MSWKVGEAPWEKNVAKNEPTSFKVGEAPWEKQPVNEEILQEMPEWLTKTDRFLVKNFSNSPQAGAKFLQQKYPGKKFKVDEDGNILAKDGESEPWKALDPQTGVFSKDILNDLGDAAYDTVGGIGQGIATTAGAIGGNLPGAVAAGAASGAGVEALRQKIGQEAGIPQDISGTDVAIAGGTGALGTLLLGAGPAKGLAQRGWQGVKSKVAPKVGEVMSGIKADTIRSYGKHMNQVDDLADNGASGYIKGVNEKINAYVDGNKFKAGQTVAQEIDNIQSGVPIADIKMQFLQKIEDAENSAFNEAGRKQAAALKQQYQEFFGETPDLLSGRQAFNLQQQLKQGAKYGMDVDDATKYAKVEGTRNAYSGVNDSFNEVSQGTVGNAKKQYAAALEMERNLLPEINGTTEDQTIQKTFQKLTNLDSNAKLALRERLKGLADQGALDITDEVDVLKAYKAFGNPASLPLSAGGTTSTSRTIPLAIAGGTLGSLAGYKMGGGYAGAALGGAIGAKVGGYAGSPEMIKRTIKANRAAENALKSIITAGGRVNPNYAINPYVAQPVGQAIAPWSLLREEEP